MRRTPRSRPRLGEWEGVAPGDEGVLHAWQQMEKDPRTVCMALVGVRMIDGAVRITVMAMPDTLAPAQVARLLRQAADMAEKAPAAGGGEA